MEIKDLEYIAIPLSGIDTKLKLPYKIYDSKSCSVVLENLTRADVEQLFGLRFIESENGSFKTEHANPSHPWSDQNLRFFLHDSKLQVKIIPKLKNGEVFDFRRTLSSAIQCGLGVLDEHAAIIYAKTQITTGTGFAPSYMSYWKKDLIDKDAVDTIRAILDYRDNGTLPKHKFHTLMALLKSAQHQAGSTDVACVLYISVLEAIYVQNNQELAYKLALRLAKKLGRDYVFMQDFIKLYSKRGKVIHGSSKGAVFTREEAAKLERLAKESLIELIRSPGKFTAEQLDQLLLQ